MRKFLTIILFIAFNFSTFAQIDTSAWEGKTVLVVTENYLATNNEGYYNALNKGFMDQWYLTDTVYFIQDSSIIQNLSNIETDTVIIVWKIQWQKILANKNCMPSPNPCDCLIWTLSEYFSFRNFQNQTWESYAFVYPNQEVNHLNEFQNLITKGTFLNGYSDKSRIIKNQCWSGEVEKFVNQWAKTKNFQVVTLYDYKYEKNNAIYIYHRSYPPTNYIEIIDLQTNRVIEKIKIPKN